LSGIAFTFRRWRVRHSYPKPIVELALRLIPIHGVAATSRLLDIPMSAIYRWRSNGLSGKAENVSPLRILLDCAERRSGQVDTASAGAAEPASAQAHFGTTAHRYVFDVRKERLERGVRRRMEGVRRVLDTQYFLDIDCRALAETAQMSRHHFIRMFGDLFGISPYQYLMRARVQAAKRLLLASSEPIEAIAVGVGFRSGPQLNRAFKHVEGTSVSNYCRTLEKCDTSRKPPGSTRAATADAPRLTPG